MRSRAAIVVVAILLGDVSLGAETSPIRYSRDVQPILAKNCFACHGPDDAHREAELRLDTAAGAVAELPGGAKAVVPNQPDESELIRRVTTADADLRMPPEKHGHPLTTEQVDVLRRWIAAGANYDRHWSFIPPEAGAPPNVRNKKWVRNDVDRFILARLEAEGLQPNEVAEPAVLVRRLYLDLIGLPPTPADVEEFVRGKVKYDAVVDKLLNSKHFGERWARPWLDVARYADSRGYGSDPLRPNIWPYRDWVIGAFNRNLPYDQFVVEQLAGDLLPQATIEQQTATAFHRNTMTNTEGGTDDEEFRVAAVHDRTHVTMQAFMGLTMGCAKCHNHKFDPLTQSDYYRLFAVFNQSEDSDKPDESPTLSLVDATEPQKKLQREKLQTEVDELRKRLKELEAPTKETPPKPLDDDVQKEVTKLKAQAKEIDSKITALKPLTVPVMRELPADKRRATTILIKGNFLVKGAAVEAGLPGALHRPPSDRPDRLALAHWVVDPQNPLTARVAVNRVWAQLFGIGLVETEEDFGIQGVAPSHPELLDWLAVEFRDRQHWGFKQFLKLIVTSSAYRQSSHVSAKAAQLDPRNRLLSHAPRYRLEAELVRDQALALAGLFSPKIGGPSVYPYQPAGLWQAAFNGERTWTTSAGEDRYRRGLYTFWRRTIPYPSMAAFDAPSREICAVRRIRTNTPLQALVTLNDPVYVEAAQALARRILRDGGSSVDERLRFALRLCTCREPQSEQVATLTKLVDAERKRYEADVAAAKKLATEPLGPLPDGLDPAEVAAWTVVANVLLNLDAVLTRS